MSTRTSGVVRDRAPRQPRVSWRRHGTTHRLGWGLADQAVSSLTNFLVVIFVARSLGAHEFGIFSLAYATYAFSLNVSRGVATDPLVVRFSGVAPTAWRTAVRVATGTATTVGCVVGVVCALVGLALSGSVGAALVALGVLLPGLLLQDSWRYAFFAAGDGKKSFVNDLTWGLALVPLVFVATRQGGVAWFVLAWGGAGGLAGLLGAVQAKIWPSVAGTRTWLSQQRELGARYFAENLSMSAVTQLRITFLGLIAGLSAVGQVRSAEVLLGPWMAVVMGLSMVAVPEAARALRRSLRALVVFCAALAVVQAVGVAAWGLSIRFLLPDALGTRLLGDLWEPAQRLVLPTTLAFAGIGLMNGAAAGLRALAAARRSLPATLVCAFAYLVGGVGGAFLGDAAGSAWGIAAATAAGAGVWWWQLREGLRDHRREGTASGRPETDRIDTEVTPL
jgi:O-antigen/teichoic acid export membrane protein